MGLLILMNFFPADGQNINSGRHNRLRKGAIRENPKLATRNRSGFRSVEHDEHFEGYKSK